MKRLTLCDNNPIWKWHELKVIFKFKFRVREMERTCLGCAHLRVYGQSKWNVTLHNVWWTYSWDQRFTFGDQVACLLTEFLSMLCKWNFQWSCWHMLLLSGHSRSTGDYLLSQQSRVSSWGTCHCYLLLASAFCLTLFIWFITRLFPEWITQLFFVVFF